MRLALRIALVWLSAKAFCALLTQTGVVVPGPTSRHARLVLAWLATRDHAADEALARTAYTALATAALVPLLFLHAGDLADPNIGAGAPVKCEDVASQPLVTRRFDLGRPFGEAKFYEVITTPARGLAAVTLARTP